MLSARLAVNLYKSISKEDKYEAARTETTLIIAKWVKEHPRATQAQTQEEVARQIGIFKAKIQTFWVWVLCLFMYKKHFELYSIMK